VPPRRIRSGQARGAAPREQRIGESGGTGLVARLQAGGNAPPCLGGRGIAVLPAQLLRQAVGRRWHRRVREADAQAAVVSIVCLVCGHDGIRVQRAVAQLRQAGWP
jgi:hypothetical protein